MDGYYPLHRTKRSTSPVDPTKRAECLPPPRPAAPSPKSQVTRDRTRLWSPWTRIYGERRARREEDRSPSVLSLLFPVCCWEKDGRPGCMIPRIGDVASVSRPMETINAPLNEASHYILWRD